MRTPHLITALAATLALAACGSGSTTSPSGAATAAAPALAGEVAKMSQPQDAFPVPSEPISDITSLRGRTVYYIPITQQAPSFTVTATALTEALDAAGVKTQICDGGSNPSSIAACVNQAVGARAAGIITDAIPYAMAANSLDAAQKAGVPVLIADQIPDDDHPAGDTLAYQEGAGTEMLSAVATWIVADSGGTAKIVLNAATDSPSARAYAQAAEKVVADSCPDCTLTVNEISSANFSLIGSQTSSAVLKTPGVGYVVSEFDQYLQPTITGVQQSGRAASVKGGSSAATLASLKMLKDKNFLHVEAAQALPFQGWTLADAVMRLALGQEVLEHEVPFRLFTGDNIGDVQLTEEAQASGEWFGPSGFQDQFRELWGVA
ncbi:substrate-binding domain-containing protein [Kineosporia sp. J2-2]|uniref:Substrate-binding domain-containing protein n=1 Tax=Kineosporia corallincola TaxID=2835133 RepID=A0ABS5TP76_9ACTN|nr:substrate-binding domain-containing protein [Kineosporia corallincola]MBT0772912.1 substrate-binding domain-containing protein [Kineosporia corallincola]